MKRTDLVCKLEQSGRRLVRHGGKHDWRQNPRSGVAQPVPRHSEVNELLARHILKKLDA